MRLVKSWKVSSRMPSQKSLLISLLDWDMIFADDEREANPTTFKFLQMAHEWSQRNKKSGGAPPALLGSLSSTQTIREPAEEENSKTKDEAEDSASDVASSQGDED